MPTAVTTASRQPVVGRDLGEHRTDRASRRDDVGEQVGAQPQLVEQLASTTCGCARRAAPVVEALVSSVTSSPVSQYANRSGMSSACVGASNGGRVACRDQLVHGVERQLLDAGGRVLALGARHVRGDLFGDAVGARVAVVHGIAEQPTVGVEQAVVDRPRVDADAGDRVRRPTRPAAARRARRPTAPGRPSAA